MKLTIGYLYADLMNIYGDTGNIICLKKRCEWRGIDVSIKEIGIGDKLHLQDADIFFFGGGQDQSQKDVSQDLTKTDKGEVLKKEVERGVPLLSVCGGYQLLGEHYKPFEGPNLAGISLFDAHTESSSDRMIGNLVIESMFGPLVGFENHSGKTYLGKNAKPFGMVIKGFGNNGSDQTEGCIHKNAIGCYMHGSLLPKNPKLADWLIQKALEVKEGKKVILKPLEDTLESKAHNFAISKFG
jgi:lipid II isoglutaminyl synthase (glutamine-hydrolysing)